MRPMHIEKSPWRLGYVAPTLLAIALVGCGEPAPPPSEALSACQKLDCGANQEVCIEDKGAAHCEACPFGTYASALSGSCEALVGTSISHEFAEFTVEPGGEIKGYCQSFTIGNAEELWVNAVELVQDEASHHSNWTFVPSDRFDGPDGVWKCSDRNYDQVSGALAGGVLYAQSTQVAHEVQKFPDGAAVRIPPYSRIIGDVHLLNSTPMPVTGSLTLTLYSIPKADVEHKLAPFHMVYSGLAIPPHAKSRFYGECAVANNYAAAAGKPFDQKLFYLLPHTHSMATGFFMSVIGGPRDGESLIDLGSYNGEAHGKLYSPPVDMTGAEGYRFGCDYTSTRDDVVHYGLGDQEMCELLGFAEGDAAFQTDVTSAEPQGMDGDVQLFSGGCSTIAFLYDFTKPGGPPP